MAWDATKPAGTQKLRLADDDIRNNNAALEDALDRDHNFPGTISVDAGEHTRVKFYAPISTPTNAANKGFLYTKDVSAKAELHWLDEDDNEVQLTFTGAPAGFESATSMPFYQDTAPTGWTIEDTLDDKMAFITKGSAAGGQTGGGAHSAGTWTQPNHTHTGPSHAHSFSSNHNHQIAGNLGYVWKSDGSTTENLTQGIAGVGGVFGFAYGSTQFYSKNNTASGTTGAGGTGATGGGATANTWRPAAYCFIIATKD